MKRTLASRCFLSILLFLTLPISASALTIGGYEIPQIIPATSQHAELKLNGASMRILYGVVDTYIGKLYLENPATDPSEIIEADEFKRMVFKIVLKRVSGRRIAKAMYEALQLNVSAEQALKLEDRLQSLVEMFDRSLRKGQESYVEWAPGEGTRVVINDELKGVIPGKDLYDSLLKIWIGESPVGSTFKLQVLGVEEYQAPRSMRRRGRR